MTCAVLIFESAASITLFVLSLALMTVVFERETSPYHNRFLGKYSCERRFVHLFYSSASDSVMICLQMCSHGKLSAPSLLCSW